MSWTNDHLIYNHVINISIIIRNDMYRCIKDTKQLHVNEVPIKIYNQIFQYNYMYTQFCIVKNKAHRITQITTNSHVPSIVCYNNLADLHYTNSWDLTIFLK